MYRLLKLFCINTFLIVFFLTAVGLEYTFAQDTHSAEENIVANSSNQVTSSTKVLYPNKTNVVQINQHRKEHIYELFISNLDGTAVRKITDNYNSDGRCYSKLETAGTPWAWSPDATKIAYTRLTECLTEPDSHSLNLAETRLNITIANTRNGSNYELLDTNTKNVHSIIWYSSPYWIDSNQIAFIANHKTQTQYDMFYASNHKYRVMLYNIQSKQMTEHSIPQVSYCLGKLGVPIDNSWATIEDISSDKRYMLVRFSDAGVLLIDTQSSKAVQLFGYTVESALFSDEDRYILYKTFSENKFYTVSLHNGDLCSLQRNQVVSYPRDTSAGILRNEKNIFYISKSSSNPSGAGENYDRYIFRAYDYRSGRTYIDGFVIDLMRTSNYVPFNIQQTRDNTIYWAYTKQAAESSTNPLSIIVKVNNGSGYSYAPFPLGILSPDVVPDSPEDTNPSPSPLPNDTPTPTPNLETKYPIIFVPGTYGTTIESTDKEPCISHYPPSQSSEPWPQIAFDYGPQSLWMVNSCFQKLLTLDIDGKIHTNENGIPLTRVGQIIEKVIFKDIYKSFLDSLTLSGKAIYRFPYDWRLDAGTNGKLLMDKINKVLSEENATKVDLIGHSQGGLVIRNMIAKNEEIATQVNKIIYVGTPHLGTTKAFASLYSGHESFDKLPSKTLRELSKNMPSAYQMLPTREFFDIYRWYYADKSKPLYSFEDTANLFTNSKYNYDLYTKSANYIAPISSKSGWNPTALNNIKQYAIVGYGLPTLKQIMDYGTEDKSRYYFTLDGDDTVLLHSANFGIDKGINEPEFIKTYYNFLFTTETRHSTLLADFSNQQCIIQILDGTDDKVSSVCNPSHLNNLDSVLSNGYMTIALHSPLTLTLIDENSRITGVSANGEISQDIPGSHFQQFGEHKYIFVPTQAKKYTLKLIPKQDSGKFDLDIHLNGVNADGELYPKNQIYFNDLFFDKSTTTYTAQVDTAVLSSTILKEVTEAGQKNIAPDASIELTDNDLTPPTSAISLSGTKGKNNWYTSNVQASISAEDTNSGIMKIRYSLNGVENEYASPFTIIEDGTHTISSFATDKSGLDQVASSEAEVKIDKTLPKITIQPKKDTYLSGEEISFTFEDDTSGIASTSAVLNGNGLVLLDNKTLRLETPGKYILKLIAEDKAGNTSSIDHTFTVSKQTGWKAEYFNNHKLEGSPVKTEFEEAIQHRWNHTGPDGLQRDLFSGRWTKQQEFNEGIYTFTVLADDGVRVWIDNTIVIDQWKDQPVTTYTATIPVIKGTHTLKIEYYEKYGSAQISFDVKEYTGDDLWKAEYFENRNLTGTPKHVFYIKEIQYTFPNTEWFANFPKDNYSARFSRTFQLEKGTYRFTTTADDGVRVRMNNTIIINNWKDQSKNTETQKLSMDNGSYDVVVEYYERTGSSILQFAVEKIESDDPLACKDGVGFINRYVDGTQGVKQNLLSIGKERSLPAYAYGLPNSLFYSLGMRGTATFQFAGAVQNVDGSDFMVYETTYGRFGYPEESSAIEVSKDGNEWKKFKNNASSRKNALGVTSFDLTELGYKEIKYIRITDTTTYPAWLRDGDGYDLNAVVTVAQLCKE